MNDFLKYKGALNYLVLSIKQEFQEEGRIVLILFIFLGSFIITIWLGELEAEASWAAAKKITQLVFTYFFTALSFIIAGFALLLSSARRFLEIEPVPTDTDHDPKSKDQRRIQYSPIFSLVLSIYYVFSIHFIGLICSALFFFLSFFIFSSQHYYLEDGYSLSFSSTQMFIVCSLTAVFFIAILSLLHFFYNMLTSSVAAAFLEKIAKQQSSTK